MAWGRYESSFVKHPKVQAIPRTQRADSVALHVAATLYCAELLTDGFVPHGVIPRLAAEVGIRGHKTLVTVLENVGLFDAVEGGIRVHDYLVYNPSAAEVKDKRRQAAERQSRHRSQTKLDVTPKVTRDVTPNVTRDALARADAPAHASARPVPSPKPLGVGEGENAGGSQPPDAAARGAAPALTLVPGPTDEHREGYSQLPHGDLAADLELTDEQRQANIDRARELAERVAAHDSDGEPAADEIRERDQRQAAARARLAHDTDADEDIPLS